MKANRGVEVKLRAFMRPQYEVVTYAIRLLYHGEGTPGLTNHAEPSSSLEADSCVASTEGLRLSWIWIVAMFTRSPSLGPILRQNIQSTPALFL